MKNIYLYDKIEISSEEVASLKNQSTFPIVAYENMLVFVFRSQGASERYYAKAISCAFKVVHVIYNMETDEVYDELEVSTYFGLRTIRANRAVFCKRRFDELSSMGLVYDATYISELVQYTNRSESQAAPLIEHRHLGWIKSNDAYYFLGHNDMNGKFRYMGTTALEQSGNISDIHELNQLIQGRVGLEIAVLTSLSSALVGLLNNTISMESLIVHFFGNSSSGKTTALQLAASMWGSPNMSAGLLTTWNSTDNAMIGRLDQNNGIALCFDESSVLKRDFSSFIYSISQNSSKQRLNKDSTLQQTKSFCTSILSSGENSLLAASNENLGLRCRILELFDCPLTDDAEHSNAIKRFAASHYGVIGFAFSEKLSAIGAQNLLSAFDSWESRMLRRMSPLCSISNRLAAKYALLLTTADILKTEFGFRINTDALIEFFSSHHKSIAAEASIGQRAYDTILNWIARNRNRLTNSPDHTSLGQTDGAFLSDNCVALIKPCFEAIIRESGFTDSSVVANELKKMGVLKPESKNKITARVMINHVRVTCYRLQLQDAPLPFPGYFTPTNPDELNF